ALGGSRWSRGPRTPIRPRSRSRPARAARSRARPPGRVSRLARRRARHHVAVSQRGGACGRRAAWSKLAERLFDFCGATCKAGGTPRLEELMSLVVRFSPESLTSDQYDRVVHTLNEKNITPADGLDYELCFGSGD